MTTRRAGIPTSTRADGGAGCRASAVAPRSLPGERCLPRGFARGGSSDCSPIPRLLLLLGRPRWRAPPGLALHRNAVAALLVGLRLVMPLFDLLAHLQCRRGVARVKSGKDEQVGEGSRWERGSMGARGLVSQADAPRSRHHLASVLHESDHQRRQDRRVAQCPRRWAGPRRCCSRHRRWPC